METIDSEGLPKKHPPSGLVRSKLPTVGEGTNGDKAAQIARLNREIEALAFYGQSVGDPGELSRIRARMSVLDLELTQARAEVQASFATSDRGDSAPANPTRTGSSKETHGTTPEPGVLYRGALDGLPPMKRDSSKPPLRPRPTAGAQTLQVQVDLHMPSIPSSMVQLFAMSATPLLSVNLSNPSDSPQSLRVISHIEGYSARAIATTQVPAHGTARIEQFPAFFCDRRDQWNELAVVAVDVEVQDLEANRTRFHRTLPIRLMARQTAVLYQLDPTTGKYRDLRHLLGAWVTPHSRPILEFLRKAADFSRLRAMQGYQVDAEGVREHVRAIFDALKSAEITYVNTVGAFGNVEGQFVQRVRLPSESLSSRSANCIDGTVLMASLLEATGIDGALILVPGHAYLGWVATSLEASQRSGVLREPEQHMDAWEFIETTLIGKGSFEQACEVARANALDFHERKQLKILPIARLRADDVMPME